MSIKHILIPIEGQDTDSYVLETAYKMGQKFNAHLEVFEVTLDGRDAIPFIGQGLSAPVVEQILHSLETESKDQRDKAFQHFNVWHQQHPELLFLTDGKMSENSKTTISWTEITGRNAELVPEKARVSDLVVFARVSANDDDLSAAMIESTLMEGGCPTLFAVDNIPQQIGSNITLFWNGSLECARAVHFALPFLKKAKKVTLLTTSKVDTMGESGAALKNYLSYHNIAADLMDLECDTSDIGASILKNSYALKADLFILGAYSHSRLREWVLGSITRYVLKEANIPCLLIH